MKQEIKLNRAQRRAMIKQLRKLVNRRQELNVGVSAIATFRLIRNGEVVAEFGDEHEDRRT